MRESKRGCEAKFELLVRSRKFLAQNFFCFHPRSFSVLPKNKKTLAHDFLGGRRVRGGWFAFFCECNSFVNRIFGFVKYGLKVPAHLVGYGGM